MDCLTLLSVTGPATLQDSIWWSGLAAADARRGMELVRQDITADEPIDGQTYWRSPHPSSGRSAPDASLLPPYNEYLIGYRDRTSAMDPASLEKFDPAPPAPLLLSTAAWQVYGGGYPGTTGLQSAQRYSGLSAALKRMPYPRQCIATAHSLPCH